MLPSRRTDRLPPLQAAALIQATAAWNRSAAPRSLLSSAWIPLPPSPGKEFADFSLMSNDFLNADSIEDRKDFEPKQWRGTHGGSPKLLKKLALKLLGQPASSSCERNWTTYAFIHSSAGNKLTPARAEDLVFTHNNHRLLSRHNRKYESGPSKMWDVGGDGFESLSGVGMLEGADLSLDEPELEEQMIEDLS